MHSRRVAGRNKLVGQDLESWPKTEPIGLSEDAAEVIRRRSIAVQMYAQHEPFEAIKKKTGVDRQSIYRMIDRCLAPGEDGRIMGFRGLVRFKHVEANRYEDPNKLQSRHAKPGVLRAFFTRYPSIQNSLWDYAVLGKIRGIKSREIDAPISKIHGFFLELCEKESIQSPHYPFNSESLGKPAIRRWVAKQRLLNGLKFLATIDPNAASAVGTGRSDELSAESANRCFQRVECDGHMIDLHCTVEIPSPSGEGVILKKVARLWIIALIEVVSRAIIGYTFSFGANYSSTDIMRAVRSSMVPWKRRSLTVKSVTYRDGDGLPNGVIEELGYACYDELWLDNAKAHLSNLFLSYHERTVGAVPVFGPVATPNARPFIEAFFGVLEESGLHRSIGTTGANHDDPRGNCRDISLESHLTFPMLADLVDLTISRINGDPAPDSSISRLEVLRRMVKRRTTIIRRIPIAQRKQAFQYDCYEPARIAKDHHRACVRYLGARYHSEVLSSAFLLVGRSVTVASDSDDLRIIECFLEDGTSIGKLIVERRWRSTAHSRATRREIIKLQNKGHRFIGDDLPRSFRLECEARARKSKRAAAQLLRLQMEQDKLGCGSIDRPDGEEPCSSDSLFTTQTDSDQPGDSFFDDVEARLKGIGAVYRR